MKLDVLAQALEDALVGKIGRDIFVHFMPDQIVEGVLLLNSLSGAAIDHELPGYRRSTFQVIVRHQDYDEGEALARTVAGILTMEYETFTGVTTRYVRPKHDPVVYPVSKGDNLEFSVNYEAVYILT